MSSEQRPMGELLSPGDTLSHALKRLTEAGELVAQVTARLCGEPSPSPARSERPSADGFLAAVTSSAVVVESQARTIIADMQKILTSMGEKS
jgi:hypothetical protein